MGKLFFGCQVDEIGMEETVAKIQALTRLDHPSVREDLNAFKINLAKSNESVKKSLQSASIINLDGMSSVWSYRIITGKSVPRVTGCDLFERMLEEGGERNFRVFLYGAEDGTLSSLLEVIHSRYPETVVSGSCHGFVPKDNWVNLLKEIETSGANIVFVGLPSPMKEEFVVTGLNHLRKGIVLIGVGGSFDVISGKTKRASKWMQRVGFEWVYRIYQEPRRMWKRYLINNMLFAKNFLSEYMLHHSRRSDQK